jgi:hypothetical protein
MKLPRRKFLHLAAGAAALPTVSRIARAQAYPSRPVRWIVPFGPAGATDMRRAPAAQLCSGAPGVTPALPPPHRRDQTQCAPQSTLVSSLRRSGGPIHLRRLTGAGCGASGHGRGHRDREGQNICSHRPWQTEPEAVASVTSAPPSVQERVD